jgi:hypothetical protein
MQPVAKLLIQAGRNNITGEFGKTLQSIDQSFTL